MRILTYKRTHIGDPDSAGQFGVNDCMGRVRNWSFDAVIGVGGLGAEPRSYGIDGRITWVGRNPTWHSHPHGHGQLVTFESFVLLDSKGPSLLRLAPYLARRMYEKGARVLFKSYSPKEKAEAEELIRNLLGNGTESTVGASSARRCRVKRTVRKGCRVAT